MEGGAEDFGLEIVELVETACEKGEPMAKITKQLRKMSERLAEDMTHSKYAEAIVKGMFLAVQTRITPDTDVLGIQNSIHAIFDTYGNIMIPYANSKTTQVKPSHGELETVAKKCVEPDSPFFPESGNIIRILSEHCLDEEAIGEWEIRMEDKRMEGSLSPREVDLLGQMDNTVIGPTGGILQGHDLVKASLDARDMGLQLHSTTLFYDLDQAYPFY